VADVFISYAREDQATVRRLHDAVVARDREAWVDWQGIEPSDRWMESVQEAIDGADAVVVVLSPASLASEVCRQEVERATAVNKRLIPVVARDIPEGAAPPAVAELNWVFAREGVDDLEEAADTIVRALDTDIDLVRTHTLVLTRAQAWELAGRRTSPLLRGDELRRAEEWLSRAAAGAKPSPTELQAAFIVESRRAAKRRQRFAVTGSLGIAVLSVGLAVFALISRSQAIHQSNVAQGQALTAESAATLPADPELSLLLARAAIQKDASPAAKLAFLTAFDLTTARAIYRRPPGVIGVAWNPRSRLTAVAGQDGSVTLWDPLSNKAVRVFRANRHAVYAVAWSPDGSVLASAGADDDVHLWQPATGTPIRTLRGHTGPILALAFSADGRYVISGSEDSTARVWQVPTGRLIHLLTGHRGFVRGVAIVPGNRFVVTAATGDGHTVLWDTRTWRPARTYQARLVSQAPNGIAVDPTGSLVAIAGEDGLVRLWKPATSSIIRTFSAQPRAPILAVAFSRDGRLLATGGLDDKARVWVAATGQLVQTYSGNRDIVDGVTFSPNADTLVTAGGDGTARAWKVTPSSAALQSSRQPRLTIPALTSGAVDPAGDLIVVAGPDGNIHAYRLGGGPQVWMTAVDKFGHGPAGLTFSPNGASIAAATSRGIVIVRARDGSIIRAMASQRTRSLAYSPDGKLIAAAGVDGRIRMWSAVTGRTVLSVAAPRLEGDIYSVAISPDGKLLAAGMQASVVRLWTLPGGLAAGVLRGPAGPVLDVAFDPDGRSLIGGSSDKRAWLWSVPGGAVIRAFQGHTGPVASVAISPDGRYLATASDDHTARIWNLGTGDTVRVLTGDTDQVTSIGFSNDGRHVVTTSGDTTLRVWDSCWFCASLSHVLDRVRPAIVRCLNAAERQAYLHQSATKDAPCAA
jgi:WD40 repeat protein